MKEIFEKANKKIMKRQIAWLLVVVMVITWVNPATFVLAAKNNSWNVNWAAEVDGAAIETYDNQAKFYVEEGQEVNFVLKLIEENIDDPDRFKETFEISLPEYLYDLITEDGESPIDWKTMSDFLLEAVEEDEKATGSNARAIRKNTVGTSSNATVSNAKRATESNSRSIIRKITLRFNKELRSEENAETIELGNAVHSNFTFVAPEDMVLICTQKKNTYEIKMVPAASASDALLKPLINTDSWNVEWDFLINGVKKNAGEDIDIKIGDKVEFKFGLKPKNNYPDLNDTFKIEMPKDMYEIIKDDFTWSKFDTPSGLMEALEKTVSGEDPQKIMISFTDRFKEAVALGNLAVEYAGCEFGFTSDKEVTISYKQNTEEDSTEITYEETQEKEPVTGIAKSISYIFNENNKKETTNAMVEEGDYVIYRIAVTLDSKDDEEEYVVLPKSVFDCFNGSVYEFIDLGKPEIAAEVTDLVNGIPNLSGQIKNSIIDGVISAEGGVQKWIIPESEELEAEIPKKDTPNYVVYGNAEQHKITNKKPLHLYICLKVKDLSGYEDDELRNYACLNKKEKNPSSSIAPKKDKYYDQSMQIYPVSIWHDKATDTKSIGKSGGVFNYPDIIKNEDAKISPGDLVTFRAVTYDQGTLPSKIKSMEFYIPLGYEPVKVGSDDLPDDFKFALQWNAEQCEGLTNRGDYKFLDESNWAGKFDLESYHKGDPLDYSKLIKGDRYTIKFDGDEMKTTCQIFITCKVKDIGSILEKAGMADTSENRILAERYGHLISAEISEIVDAVDTKITVKDEDSYIDNNPFNDWYNNQLGEDTKLKHQGLYYYSGYTNGEVDGQLAHHVKSDTGIWTIEGERLGFNDEDDFDFAILPIYKPGKLTDSKGINKEIKNSDTDPQEVIDILKDIDKKIDPSGETTTYENSYHTLVDGKISQVKTVIPYGVYINIDGSKTMEDVIFTDELPETMSFLTQPNGKPVVTIYERIEENGHRFPVLDEHGKTVEIIAEGHSKDYRVKNPLDDEFDDHSGDCSRPTGISAENKWNYGIEDKTLTIDFGDIGDNAYYVVYYVVVDKVSNFYRNSASIAWQGDKIETDHVDFSSWGGSTGRIYGKLVNNGNGEFVAKSQLVDIEQEGSLTYRLQIMISGANHVYAPGDLIYYDYLDDLFGGGCPSNILVTDIKCKDLNEQVIPDSESSFDIDVDEEKSELRITNNKELTNESSYIEFTVHYKEIPYGATIKNAFGAVATEVETPLKINLLKVDGALTDVKGLMGAEFDLYYGDDQPVMGLDSQSIILKTDLKGEASVSFFPDSGKEKDGSFDLYLKESKEPYGYYELGGKNGNPANPYIIKLKVTKDADSKYSVETVEGDTDYSVISTGNLNEIQIIAKNYKEATPLAGASLYAKKTLTGRDLIPGEFGFNAKLIKKDSGSTVSLNGGEIELQDIFTSVNSSGDVIKFPEVEFNKAGDYVFELSEDATGSVAGITYDGSKYYAQVSVSEDSANKLSAVVTYYESYENNAVGKPITEVPEFKNTYAPEGVSLNLKLYKKLYGANGTEKTNLPKYTFTVSLSDGPENAVTIPDTVANNTANGLIEMKNIEILKAGTYVFEIKETSGGNAGIIYDGATINATVIVEEKDGSLEVKKTTYDKSRFTVSEGKDTFVNTIKSTGAKLKADKNLTGRTLKENEFIFNAKLVKTVSGATVKSDQNTISLNGNLEPVKNTLTGAINFPEVQFNQAGSYIFELSEDATGGAADITYDKTKYYAQVNVSENTKTKELDAVVTYHDSYNKSTQTVGNVITPAIPNFENAIKELISIRKISISSGAPLAGAKFTISYQLKGSSDGVWMPLYTDLETTGSDGSVSFELPDKYWTYNYKMTETKAPYGYKTSRVGLIIFTVARDGTIDTCTNDGSSGYVEVSNDKTALIVKNQLEDSSGGGEDPGPTKPTPTKPSSTDPTPTDPSPTDPSPTLPYIPDPDKPGIVVPPGEIVIEGPDGPIYEGKTPDGHIDIELPPGRYKITVIGEDGIPLTYFMDVPVPLSGLARTGDNAASAFMLAVIMLAALGAFGTLVYVKRKHEKYE